MPTGVRGPLDRERRRHSDESSDRIPAQAQVVQSERETGPTAEQ
jgi:hypothetical protein